MNLKEYIEKLKELFDQPDVKEATFDIGIVMVNGEPIVCESSPNRVKFTVKREKQ